jgi:hypothetical protein
MHCSDRTLSVSVLCSVCGSHVAYWWITHSCDHSRELCRNISIPSQCVPASLPCERSHVPQSAQLASFVIEAKGSTVAFHRGWCCRRWHRDITREPITAEGNRAAAIRPASALIVQLVLLLNSRIIQWPPGFLQRLFREAWIPCPAWRCPGIRARVSTLVLDTAFLAHPDASGRSAQILYGFLMRPDTISKSYATWCVANRPAR